MRTSNAFVFLLALGVFSNACVGRNADTSVVPSTQRPVIEELNFPYFIFVGRTVDLNVVVSNADTVEILILQEVDAIAMRWIRVAGTPRQFAVESPRGGITSTFRSSYVGQFEIRVRAWSWIDGNKIPAEPKSKHFRVVG